MAVEIRPKQSSLAVKVERNDHTTLTHRNEPNQHTIEAVTGLAEALTNLNNLIVNLQNKTNMNEAESVEVINTLTENLTKLINDETKRATDAEATINKKLDLVDKDVISLGNELSTRIDNMQVVENELRTKIINEAARAVEEEKVLDNKIITECARAQREEERIVSLVGTEEKRAKEQEILLSKAIDHERLRALEAEARLEAKGSIGSMTAEINAAVKSLEESVDLKLATKADLDTLSTKADLIEGKIPDSQLPESCKSSNIFEAYSMEDFPTMGLTGNLYVSTSTNIIYRWDGETYVEISSTKFNDDTPVQIICEV